MSSSVILRRSRKIFWLLVKIAAVLAALFLIIITMLANLGGTGDRLKQSAEGYLSNATGYNAQIGQLNAITFFPRLSFDFENVTFSEAEDELAVAPVAWLDLMRFSMSFWDVAMGTGRFDAFRFEGLEVLPGVLTPQPLNVDRVSMFLDQQQSNPYVRAEGRVGSAPFVVSMDVGIKNGVFYFPDTRHISIDLGESSLTTIFKMRERFIYFEDIRLTHNSQPVAEGQVNLTSTSLGGVKLDGDIGLKENGSQLSWSIFQNGDMMQNLFQVTINGEEFHNADITKESRLGALTAMLLDLLVMRERFTFPVEKLELSVDFDHFIAAPGADPVPLNEKIEIDNARIVIERGDVYPLSFEVRHND